MEHGFVYGCLRGIAMELGWLGLRMDWNGMGWVGMHLEEAYDDNDDGGACLQMMIMLACPRTKPGVGRDTIVLILYFERKVQ